MRIENGCFTIVREGSGVEHRYNFSMALDGETCYLEFMEQGGESYKPAVQDIPDAVIEKVEEWTGLEVVER